MRAQHGAWIVLLTAFTLSGCPAADEAATQDASRATPRDGGANADGADSADAPTRAEVSVRTDGGALPEGGSGLDAVSAGDGASDGSVADRVSDGTEVSCEPRETCADGIDNNCNGRVDEDCPCTPGMEQRCFPSRYIERGVCSAGRQVCMGTGEFGRWSQCQNAVEPSPEVCDGADNDCDGVVDQDLSRPCYPGPTGTSSAGACHDGSQRCEAGAWGGCAGAVTPTDETCNGLDDDCDGMVDEDLSQSCYPGPAGTSGVGRCHGGTARCVMGSFGVCVGAVVPATEICGNGMDEDCDGMVDEGCRPCIMGMASSSPWQIHRVMGPVCFGRTFSVHGERGEYDLATIPAEGDSGWRPVTTATIDFSAASSLCGRACTCLNGGEFTYFQTFFDISAGYRVTSLGVTMGGVDDGARITVFNSAYPTGVVDSGSYVLLGGTGTSTDLARFITTGRNRIVITHIDDCCSARSLTGVRVVLNGGSLETCP